MYSKSSSSPRRTHRKRGSALHLSTDTTATLPEYRPASATVHSWKPRHSQDSSFEDQVPSDKPPDYPDSAEEADEDTDSEDPRNTLFLHQHPTAASALPRTPLNTSPRRKQRYYQHRRKHSTPTPTSLVDPYLDSLLERSVHALEMSNTLLQSSMTTENSLSTVAELICDSPADANLEASAVNLSTKINGRADSQPPWMDDLEEIWKRVDSLVGNGVGLDDVRAEGHDQHMESGIKIRTKEDWSRQLRSSSSEVGLSSSLPTVASPSQCTPYRRPSLLGLREAAEAQQPRLRLSHQTRNDLISPPPRALTQYIEFDADPAFVALPSTLGIRSGNPLYPNADWNASTSSLHSSPALPVVTNTTLPSSSTPAYTKLASFVIKCPSNSTNATPCSPFTSTFTIKRRNSSTGSLDRSRHKSSPQSSPRRSPEIIRSHTNTGSPFPHHHRPMTPPAEESSSSSDGCVAKQTISSLRHILNEQAQKEVPKPATKKNHTFMPVTPAPVPVSSTSTATASISRMLTKKLHHLSTRAPSPPRQSAMKGSRPSTPSSSTFTGLPPSLSSSATIAGDMLTVPERIMATVHNASGSSSGRSTPKRISFAELPEAHISSRPEKFIKDKGKRKAKKGGQKNSKGDGSEEEMFGGWIATLLGLGSNSGISSVGRQDERMEDKFSRTWSGRAGGGGGYGYFDEWAA